MALGKRPAINRFQALSAAFVTAVLSAGAAPAQAQSVNGISIDDIYEHTQKGADGTTYYLAKIDSEGRPVKEIRGIEPVTAEELTRRFKKYEEYKAENARNLRNSEPVNDTAKPGRYHAKGMEEVFEILLGDDPTDQTVRQFQQQNSVFMALAPLIKGTRNAVNTTSRYIYADGNFHVLYMDQREKFGENDVLRDADRFAGTNTLVVKVHYQKPTSQWEKPPANQDGSEKYTEPYIDHQNSSDLLIREILPVLSDYAKANPDLDVVVIPALIIQPGSFDAETAYMPSFIADFEKQNALGPNGEHVSITEMQQRGQTLFHPYVEIMKPYDGTEPAASFFIRSTREGPGWEQEKAGMLSRIGQVFDRKGQYMAEKMRRDVERLRAIRDEMRELHARRQELIGDLPLKQDGSIDWRTFYHDALMRNSDIRMRISEREIKKRLLERGIIDADRLEEIETIEERMKNLTSARLPDEDAALDHGSVLLAENDRKEPPGIVAQDRVLPDFS